MKKSVIALAALLCLPAAARSQKIIEIPAQGARYKITINDANAFVSDRRTVDLEAGRSQVRFNDVSPKLAPASVQPFLFGAPFDVLDQTFIPYEGVDQGAILRRYIGQQVTLIRQDEPALKGTLLSLEGVVLLDTADGVVVNPQGTWMLPRSGDITPRKSVATLQWLADAPTAGSRDIEAHYTTAGLKWLATYRASLNEGESRLAFRGWVTIENKSGVDYRNAEVAFSRTRFDKPIDLPDGETHQYSYFSAKEIAVKPEFFFDGAIGGGYPKRIIRLTNSSDIGLGLELPGGGLQLWGNGTDGGFQLLSDQTLPTLRPNERFTIVLGEYKPAFVQRAVVRSRELNPETQEDTIQFSLVNTGAAPVEIIVTDGLPENATVTETSLKPAVAQERRLEWRVTVPPDNKETPLLLKYVIQVKKKAA